MMTQTPETSAPQLPPVDASTRSTGRLIRIHPAGFGFIRADDHPGEYFVHVSDFPSRAVWQLGQAVEFTPSYGMKGRRAPRANQIKVL